VKENSAICSIWYKRVQCIINIIVYRLSLNNLGIFILALKICLNITCQIILAFWLALSNYHLDDRWIDDIINTVYFVSLLYGTYSFHVAVRLFSNWSEKTSKCGKNISDTICYCLVCHRFLFSQILTSSFVSN